MHGDLDLHYLKLDHGNENGNGRVWFGSVRFGSFSMTFCTCLKDGGVSRFGRVCWGR